MPQDFQFNFGRLTPDGAPPRRVLEQRARIALLGDFSGRAHRGERRIGDALAQLKPQRLDPDTLETVLQRFGTRLRLTLGVAGGGGTVELSPRSLDDLHPDAMFDSLALFAELVRLRKQLAQPATSAAAAAQVRQWAPEPGAVQTLVPAQVLPRSDALRTDASLIDFVALFGLPALTPTPSPIDALIREVIRPHLKDSIAPVAPDAAELTAAVDRALSASMRELLHHPDFQGLEAAWRSLEFIVRRVEADTRLQVEVYDISAEEFAADLGATDALEDTGLYRLLVARSAREPQQAPLTALVGLYSFARTAPHAELLGRIGAIAKQASAPFVAAIGHQALGQSEASKVPEGTDDASDPSAVLAWQDLRALPVAHFLALATPGFLLRQPYGRRLDPIDRFAFEEFDPGQPPASLLWGNPAVLAAVLLGQHLHEAEPGEAPARQLDLDNLPLCVWTDADGQAVAQPCVEQTLSDRMIERVQRLGFIPVVQRPGRDEARFGGFVSLAGTRLAGRWTTTG